MKKLLSSVILISVLSVAHGGGLPTIDIAYGGWDMVPIARYTINQARDKATYKIRSENVSFHEFITEAIDEDSLRSCFAELDSYHQIRLVVDVQQSGEEKRTFVSDGIRLFSADMKRCRLIDEGFKDRFRITAFDKPE